ncbi:hypothetical protein JT206_03785 [Helicobacter pylori]|nr:hypothetical protein [Helicobacter pylori]
MPKTIDTQPNRYQNSYSHASCVILFPLSFLINSVNSFSKFFTLFLSPGDEGIVKEYTPSVSLFKP